MRVDWKAKVIIPDDHASGAADSPLAGWRIVKAKHGWMNLPDRESVSTWGMHLSRALLSEYLAQVQVTEDVASPDGPYYHAALPPCQVYLETHLTL
ncbi:MAG: hypothetical protein MSB12_07420 [Lentisphaeraceae bacterium]|nr:hypothetical protein [Lentisphaeraceae bacterium]